MSRKLITYSKWFAAPLDEGGKPQLPRYLKNQSIPPDIMRNVTRFRTSSHHLRVETDRWSKPVRNWNERICTLCDIPVVQDEMHVICECRDKVLVDVRDSLSEKGLDLSDLLALMNSENTFDLCLCINVCMKRIDCVFSSRRAAL